MKAAVNLTIQFLESRYQKKFHRSLMFFCPPTTEWRPCKFLWNWTETIFQWLIFSNFTNIRHLVYWKCIIWAKSDLLIINSVCEKVCFRIDGMSKMLFHFTALFIFPNFKWLLSKLLRKNNPFVVIDFKGPNEVLLRHKYFWSTYFLFLLKERNITTSLLLMHLKCTVVHYANLNSSSINKPYLRAVKCAIPFSSNSYLRLF